MVDAVLCQTIELALFQPVPNWNCSKLPRRMSPPSMFTMSKSSPAAQEPTDPLKPCVSSASHCTKALGPAAQKPAAKSCIPSRDTHRWNRHC